MLNDIQFVDTPCTIRTMVVDDHPLVRAAYREVLEKSGEASVVAETDDGDIAYALYLEHRPDIAIIDLNICGTDGLEVVRRIRTRDEAARILVFSAQDHEIHITRALEAGAAGYLSKRGTATQMLDAVRTVAHGKPYIDPEHVNSIAYRRLFNCDEDPLQTLSPREFQIFRCLANGDSPGEIASKLFISPKTVSVHQGHIMKKLELKNIVQLVRLAINCHAVDP